MFHSPTTTRSDQSYGEFYAYDLVTLPSKSSPQAVPSFFSLGETTLDTPKTTTTGFLSRDPIGYEGSEWLLYEYCNSTPHNEYDPLGLQSSTIRIDILIGSGATPQEIASVLGVSVGAAIAAINAHNAAKAAEEAATKLKEAVDSLVDKFTRNAKGKSPCELAESAVRQAEKSIRGHEKVIFDHEGYNTNPSSYPRAIRDLESVKSNWRRDIARAKDNINKAKSALEILQEAAKIACWCWYNPGRW